MKYADSGIKRLSGIVLPVPKSVSLLLLIFCFGTVSGCVRHTVAKPEGKIHYRVSSTLAPASKQILRRQINASPGSLDPALIDGIPGSQVCRSLFIGLTTQNEEGKVVPGVASSWTVKDTGRLYLFHLRHDARWSNGRKVTAADFVYAWRREVNPQTGAPFAESLNPIVNAKGIIAGRLSPATLGVRSIGRYTLEVKLNAPTPYFSAMLATWFMSPLYPPSIKHWGDEWTRPPHLVSDGAFFLKSWLVNGHLTLLKNPYYWDARRVQLRKVIFYPISNSASATSQYLAGNLDWTDKFPAADYRWLKRRLAGQVYVAPSFGNAYLEMLIHQPPFNNRDLRIAMSMALDRKVLVKDIMHGLALPAWTLLPPLPGYIQPIPSWARWSRAKRLTKARMLYHAAGYSRIHPLRVRLTYPNGGPDQRHFMEALATMWRQNLGAHVTLWNEQWKVFLQNIQYRHAKLFWSAWIGPFRAPFAFMQLFQAGFAMNYSKFDDSKYQELMAAAAHAANRKERLRIYEQAGRLLEHEMPYIPMYFYTSTHLVKPYVGGWQTNLTDHHPSRYMYILSHQAKQKAGHKGGPE